MPVEEQMPYPSLLGRDILSKWRMIYSPQEGHLSFEVRYRTYASPIPLGLETKSLSPRELLSSRPC